MTSIINVKMPVFTVEAKLRISKEAAAANRARVVKAAARLFREKGVDAIAVSDLMKAAGLTHGGFYNHFDSKDALAAAAYREAFDQAVARAERNGERAQTEKPGKVLAEYVDRYLSRETLNSPGTSCPMSALGTDAARHGSLLRGEFAQGVRRYMDAFARLVPGKGRRQRKDALTTLSTLIGAVTLARACAGADDTLADEILDAVGTSVKGAHR